MKDDINNAYTTFYKNRNPQKVYPTEFVVRTFLAKYPALKLTLKSNSKVLDLGFGDGRNTAFLIEQGYEVYGIEITKEIVDLTAKRLANLGLSATLKIGRNRDIPFEDDFFDVILGCHVSYYCDGADNFQVNLKEFARVLKPKGWFITSLADINSYIFKDAELTSDNLIIIKNDPFNNRKGCRLRAFASKEEIIEKFSGLFENFSFGTAHNNYYGIDERVFWVVCQKK